ncbi:MAG TPA: FecR domain-containing protein, partial [Fibrobacteria bacterium]|nr:FecR domain-containing protein [Fibrobacteria bacterium]
DWEAGQARVFDGGQQVAWEDARCEVQGTNAHLTLSRMDEQTIQLRMDQGQATFHVQPRRAGETFQVDLAKDCQVQVVGTTFTVGVDSLKAWVDVQEGRVRLQAAGEGQFVDPGARAQCPDSRKASANPMPKSDSARTEDAPPTIPVAASQPVSVQVEVPACNEPGPCVTVLSNFVRQHPGHPAVSEVALRWGRLAARGGDPRDALVGYSHVKSPVLAPMARLESLQLRAREFGEQAAVADSLDRWLAGLKESHPLFKPVAQLRVELYRRQGNDSGARSLEERISGSATAQTRGR